MKLEAFLPVVNNYARTDAAAKEEQEVQDYEAARKALKKDFKAKASLQSAINLTVTLKGLGSADPKVEKKVAEWAQKEKYKIADSAAPIKLDPALVETLDAKYQILVRNAAYQEARAAKKAINSGTRELAADGMTAVKIKMFLTVNGAAERGIRKVNYMFEHGKV